jgi:hypothetical protein
LATEIFAKLKDPWLLLALGVALLPYLSQEPLGPAVVVLVAAAAAAAAARLLVPAAKTRAGFLLIFAFTLLWLRIFSASVVFARTGELHGFFTNLPNAFGLMADSMVAFGATVVALLLRSGVRFVQQRAAQRQ